MLPFQRLERRMAFVPLLCNHVLQPLHIRVSLLQLRVCLLQLRTCRLQLCGLGSHNALG